MDELNRVVIAAPCPISWEDMDGDARVRFCSSCSKNVYNLSDMTAKEAQDFLQENGSSQCVRLYRRADGTVMTDNCPVGLRALRNRARVIYKLIAGAAASILAFVPSSKSGAYAQSTASPKEEPHVTGGKPTLPDSANRTTPTPTMMGGAIAIPPPGNGTGKKIMMGGECGTGAKKQDPGKGGKFQMGEMVVAPKSKEEFKRDGKALELYEQAQANEKTGNLLVAKTQYQQALDSARKQEKSDPKFQESLQQCIDRVSKKITH